MNILDLIPENLRPQLYKEVVEALKKDSTGITSKDLLKDLAEFVKGKDEAATAEAKETINDVMKNLMP